MASLTLTIGLLNATIAAENNKATSLLTRYAEAIGATGTNQQKADAVVLSLVQHMMQEARRVRGNRAMSEAVVAIQVELDGLAWE